MQSRILLRATCDIQNCHALDSSEGRCFIVADPPSYPSLSCESSGEDPGQSGASEPLPSGGESSREHADSPPSKKARTCSWAGAERVNLRDNPLWQAVSRHKAVVTALERLLSTLQVSDGPVDLDVIMAGLDKLHPDMILA